MFHQKRTHPTRLLHRKKLGRQNEGVFLRCFSRRDEPSFGLPSLPAPRHFPLSRSLPSLVSRACQAVQWWGAEEGGEGRCLKDGRGFYRPPTSALSSLIRWSKRLEGKGSKVSGLLLYGGESGESGCFRCSGSTGQRTIARVRERG